MACLVRAIMSQEEESATSEKREQDNSFLVLPRFDCGARERGRGRCSGCSSLKPIPLRREVGMDGQID